MNRFASNGSPEDLISLMQSDILDTYNHQTDVLHAIIDAEDTGAALDFIFSDNDHQYYGQRALNDAKLYIYEAKTGGSNMSPVSVIDMVDSDLSTGLYKNIDELEAAIADKADSTYLMYQLANLTDSTKIDEDVLAKFSASCSSWINEAGAGARETFHSIIDSLSTGGGLGGTALAWLGNQYISLSNVTGDNSTGAFQFSDTNYHVQGFAGQYALQVGFQLVSTVVTTVATVIAPIVGIAIGVISATVNALISLIPDKSDSIAQEKESTSSVFAVPAFQGTFTVNQTISDPLSHLEIYGTNAWAALQEYGSISVRCPGWIINAFYDSGANTIQYEALLSIDFTNFLSYDTDYYAHGMNQGVEYTCKYPFAKYWGQQVGGQAVATDPATIWKVAFSADNMKDTELYFMGDWVQGGSLSTFLDQVNEYHRSIGAAAINDTAAWEQFDNTIRASICWSYWRLFNDWCANLYSGTLFNNADISYSGWYDLNSVAEPVKEVLRRFNAIMYACCATAGNGPCYSWDNLVNGLIPEVREYWRDTSAAFVALISYASHHYDTWHCIMKGKICGKNPRFYPPKYSTSARSTTVTLAVLAGVVIAGTIITKGVLKVSQRKKQISRYDKVTKLKAQCTEDPTNMKLQKEYRKAVKSYNRWARFTGTSRLSYISGWESGDSSTLAAAPSSLTGVYDAYKAENPITQTVDSEDTVSDIGITQILRLISGN